MSIDIEKTFPDHPLLVLEMAKKFQDAGFDLTEGTGREYYLIIATKESANVKVRVELDDEWNVDVYCFAPKDSEYPSHKVYFPKVNREYQVKIKDYVDALFA